MENGVGAARPLLSLLNGQFSTVDVLRPGAHHLKRVWEREIRAAKLRKKPKPPDFEMVCGRRSSI
jgi:hypothetical protein